MRTKLLILCGPSGCGKNYIENQLINNNSPIHYHDSEYIFKKLPQMTTRKPRNQKEIDDKIYDFVSKDTFIKRLIEDNYRYIAHTVIKTDDGETNFYASYLTDEFLNNTQSKVIFTVIANYYAINNIHNSLSYNTKFNNSLDDYLTFMISATSLEDMMKYNKRDNRDLEFIKNEEKDLIPYTDKILKNDFKNNKMIQVEDIMDLLQLYNWVV